MGFVYNICHIERMIVDSIVAVSHEVFVGKVEYVHADEKLVDSNGKIDFTQIKFM